MLPIVQFSPPRSGSTLCYNAIKWIAPDRRVKKTHGIEYRWFLCPIITTIRDPLDIIVSSCESSAYEINDEIILELASKLKKSWAGLRKIKYFPRSLILEYDLIHKDYDYMLDQIARFLRIEIRSSTREKFKTEFDVAKIHAGTKGVSFGEFDKETHLHGSHISNDLGMPGKGQRLNIKQREIVKSVLELS